MTHHKQQQWLLYLNKINKQKVGPISFSTYPHANVVSITSQRVSTKFDTMGLL
jgi:hypothetical protein